MTTIRAKFRCNSAEKTEGGTTVQLSAVTDGREENKSFSEYTPVADLSMTITDNTSAADFFQQDKEYYLDFSEANS